MLRTLLLAAPVISVLLACQASPTVVDVDPDQREPLLSTLAALEGRWEGTSEDEHGEAMQPVHDFRVSSGGSAVREVMFPGSDHEMTNMYTLDGNTLVMTHYCAVGNQPHMRATALDGNRLVFETSGVSDLKSDDEVYMGEMTLVVIDADHIEQHWKALKNGVVDHESTFELRRVR